MPGLVLVMRMKFVYWADRLPVPKVSKLPLNGITFESEVQSIRLVEHSGTIHACRALRIDIGLLPRTFLILEEMCSAH